MNKPIHITVVTGSRAEYGLMRSVILEMKEAKDFKLSIIVTGTHLEKEFGFTVKEIEEDGLDIDARIKIITSDDTGFGAAKAMGKVISGVSEELEKYRPDYVMLLGDRYEILAAAQTALIMLIPIIHFSGGDITEGAFDDSIRHAITKMSSVHFVASAEAGQRVEQLGEESERVHVVGDPGLDILRQKPLIEREELEDDLGFKFKKRNFLITFHPTTLDLRPSRDQFSELLDALSLFRDTKLIFTRPNVDPEGRELLSMMLDFVNNNSNALEFPSLGHHRYLSLMNQVDVVIGNSSSGLLEAPSLEKPTVNIGLRQSGRLQSDSVVNCMANSEDILLAINNALDIDCRGIKNPYGDGKTAPRVLKILRDINNPRKLLKKSFRDFPEKRSE
tara:strand:- start:24387 stop:25556 length:1170 start_codon:yes stop_codon:yes gene_type:complete